MFASRKTRMRLYFLKHCPNSKACDSSDSAASNSAIRSCEYISTGSVTAGRKRIPSEVVSAMRLSWGRIPAACRMAAGREMRPRLETERVTCMDSIYRKAENLQHPDASSAFAAVMQGESIPWMESPQVLLVHCSLKKAPHPIFTAHSDAIRAQASAAFRSAHLSRTLLGAIVVSL